MKQWICRNVSNLTFMNALFGMFDLSQKLTLGSFQLWLVVVTLIDFSNLSKNMTVFRNLNYH